VLDILLAWSGWHFTFTLKFFAEAIARASPVQLSALLVLVAVGAPVGEEVFFRGFAQTRLVARWGRWPGILVAAALFGVLHLDPLQGPLAFLLGVFLGWIAERGQSIRPAMVAHGLNNAVAVVTVRWFAQPAGNPPSVTALLASGVLFAGCVGGVFVATRGAARVPQLAAGAADTPAGSGNSS
jgi:membrane protease YdiL (CAAX protease family)